MAFNIGMIGAGWVSANHLPAYRSLQGRARVAAIADPASDAREGRAAEFGIERTYSDATEMLKAGGLDAVDITSPRELHTAHVRLAAEHGLPVICQKPLAPTLGEARALIDELSGRVPLMVHENWRWRPHYRMIREWIDAGRIGRPLHAQMSLFTSGLLPDSSGSLPSLVRQPMMRDLERFLIMEVMIHHIDCLRFLLGDLDLVGCRYSRVCPQVLGEDNATLYLKTTSGGSVVVAGSFSAQGYDARLFDRLEIIGDAGTIRLQEDRLDLVGRETRRERLDLDANYSASYRGAINHFLQCLESGAAFETGPLDNLKTLDIVERAYELGRADWSAAQAKA